MTTAIKFKSISLRNFLSFGNFEQTFYLDTGSTTSITGENIDIGGSNGSGKCVCINTKIKIRNRRTGEIQECTVGELYENTKNAKIK